MIEGAANNFSTTYLRLGSSLPGIQRFDTPEYKALVTPGLPTIANFAVDLHLDPWAVRRLSEFATNPDFRVYLQSSEKPAHSAELLERGEFGVVSSLDHLLADRLDDEGLIVSPSEEAEEIADFIVAQFLARNREIERKTMRDTLVGAEGIELYELISPAGDRIAAAITCMTGELTGIYNFCVRADRRGSGVGSGFLKALRRSAKTPYICLQCYSPLTSWYRREGFEQIGSIQVFARNSGKVGGY